MLESKPTPNGHVTEVTERLLQYSRTSSDLKKLLPSVEKNLLKIKKSKFSKILTLGYEPTPTRYVTEVSERLHHFCRTSSDLKKLLTTTTTQRKRRQRRGHYGILKAPLLVALPSAELTSVT